MTPPQSFGLSSHPCEAHMTSAGGSKGSLGGECMAAHPWRVCLPEGGAHALEGRVYTHAADLGFTRQARAHPAAGHHD